MCVYTGSGLVSYSAGCLPHDGCRAGLGIWDYQIKMNMGKLAALQEILRDPCTSELYDQVQC